MRVAAIAFLVSILSGSALALDIKGIEVDKPADCEFIRSLEVGQDASSKDCERRKTFFIKVSFLDGHATLGISKTDQGVVQSIRVTDFSFDPALYALTKKFGEPEVKRSVVQNRMGAQFEQIEARWTDGVRRMVLQKHGNKLDEPILLLWGVEIRNELREKKEQGAGNI